MWFCFVCVVFWWVGGDVGRGGVVGVFFVCFVCGGIMDGVVVVVVFLVVGWCWVGVEVVLLCMFVVGLLVVVGIFFFDDVEEGELVFFIGVLCDEVFFVVVLLLVFVCFVFGVV